MPITVVESGKFTQIWNIRAHKATALAQCFEGCEWSTFPSGSQQEGSGSRECFCDDRWRLHSLRVHLAPARRQFRTIIAPIAEDKYFCRPATLLIRVQGRRAQL